MDIDLVTDPYACMMYILSPLAGLGGGAYCGGLALTVCFVLLQQMAANRNIVDGSDSCLDDPSLSSQVPMSACSWWYLAGGAGDMSWSLDFWENEN